MGNKLTVLSICLAAGLAILPACGKKDGGGAAADKVDVAALKEGTSHTAKLKFWMKERGVTETGLVDNVHFDDGANQRIVLTYDEGLADKVGKLEQNKVYKVTFKATPGEAVHKGHMTAVE